MDSHLCIQICAVKISKRVWREFCTLHVYDLNAGQRQSRLFIHQQQSTQKWCSTSVRVSTCRSVVCWVSFDSLRSKLSRNTNNSRNECLVVLFFVVSRPVIAALKPEQSAQFYYLTIINIWLHYSGCECVCVLFSLSADILFSIRLSGACVRWHVKRHLVSRTHTETFVWNLGEAAQQGPFLEKYVTSNCSRVTETAAHHSENEWKWIYANIWMKTNAVKGIRVTECVAAMATLAATSLLLLCICFAGALGRWCARVCWLAR